MKDPSIPSFVVQTEQQIDITIAPTDAIIVSQGYKYNQPGFTYNQPGVLYGGLAQSNQDLNPTFISENTSDAPSNIKAEATNARLISQGYTYNQPGFTYNQIGWMYGGIYNQNADLAPAFNNDTALLLNPAISSIIDIYSPFVPPPANSGYLMGIMGLTYP